MTLTVMTTTKAYDNDNERLTEICAIIRFITEKGKRENRKKGGDIRAVLLFRVDIRLEVFDLTPLRIHVIKLQPCWVRLDLDSVVDCIHLVLMKQCRTPTREACMTSSASLPTRESEPGPLSETKTNHL